jgi:hypothetical protein
MLAAEEMATLRGGHFLYKEELFLCERFKRRPVSLNEIKTPLPRL